MIGRLAGLAARWLGGQRRALGGALDRLAAPVAVGLLVVLALRNGIAGDFFYDEAVYANLALHPFRTDYYFDPIFFRHPPFIHLFYWLVAQVVPGVAVEVSFRVASLAFASAGLVVLAGTLRSAVEAPALRVGALWALASSDLFVRYSLSATMYPFAFLFLVLVLHGLVTGRGRVSTAGFILLVYTHYFGQVVFALYVVALRLQGREPRMVLREQRAVVLAWIPIALVTLAGFVYHVLRFRLDAMPHKYAVLAFYVPYPLWTGLAFAAASVLRPPSRTRAAPIWLLVSILASLFFVAIAGVTPPFERYCYFFLPAFMVAGLWGVEEIARRLPGRGLGTALVLSAVPLCFLPAHALADAQPGLFINYFADNNRFQGWQKVVDACRGQRVLTNNARSYAYYLARRDGRRYRLKDLDDGGALRQFDGPADLPERLEEQKPGCVAVDRHQFLTQVVDVMLTRFPECRTVDLGGATRLFRCRPRPSTGPLAGTAGGTLGP